MHGRDTGGGWWAEDGPYDWFRYAGSAARRPIDFLEGDVVVRCCYARSHDWSRMMVPFGIDNQAFQLSAASGRSRAPRLNGLLRPLFNLQVQGTFILDPFWLSTTDNGMADDLSRDREDSFITSFNSSYPDVDLLRAPDAGRVVNFAPDPGPPSSDPYSSAVRIHLPARDGLSPDTSPVSPPEASSRPFPSLHGCSRW